MSRQPSLRVALIFAASLLGISFAAIFVRLALPAPPVVTGFYRMLFATLLVGAWLAVRRQPVSFRGRAALAAIAAGVCLGLDLAMWHTSIVLTSVAMATLLVNTTPLYVGLWAALVERVRFETRFVLGRAARARGHAAAARPPARRARATCAARRSPSPPRSVTRATCC